jgi:hypothetical protein
MDAMASRIVNWLIGKSPQPGGSLLRGDLILPELRSRSDAGERAQ